MAAAQHDAHPSHGSSQARHRVLFKLASIVKRFPSIVPPLDVTHIDVPVVNLPPELENFTIAQVSDLHVAGGDWWPPRLSEAVQAVHDADPDVFVNTGDFMQWEPPIEDAVAASLPFAIRAHDGLTGPVNLAIMGNHDHYAGEDAVADLGAELTQRGIRVLTNEVVTLSRAGSPIVFVGLSLESPGFESAVAAMEKAGHPRIVLGHAPEVAERIPPGSADLVLSGHTHGGQITLPFLTPLIVRKFNGSHYIEGRYRVNGNPLYINRGLGCTGLPIRFRAAPEVTIIRLVR